MAEPDLVAAIRAANLELERVRNLSVDERVDYVVDSWRKVFSYANYNRGPISIVCEFDDAKGLIAKTLSCSEFGVGSVVMKGLDRYNINEPEHIDRVWKRIASSTKGFDFNFSTPYEALGRKVVQIEVSKK